ncbi:3210_t:CDS:2 [Acaulospora morrowiae]|uniref:3210_t:CDS:1 n=1 Tax=Acaulospora morrowiae TaxID=94023 RepID=A0A9N9FC19_9GLOM|nr:3210_t:CDS:2 [Acaulospora morrowiae]
MIGAQFPDDHLRTFLKNALIYLLSDPNLRYTLLAYPILDFSEFVYELL